MYLCILDRDGETVLHRNLRSRSPRTSSRPSQPFRDDLVVGVECIFTWYWLADLCPREGIHFVLGHALYMKAIHGGKAKNDKIDALKIATLLRGGNLSRGLRLSARRCGPLEICCEGGSTWFASERASFAHIQNTAITSTTSEPPAGRSPTRRNREGVAEAFPIPIVRKPTWRSTSR